MREAGRRWQSKRVYIFIYLLYILYSNTLHLILSTDLALTSLHMQHCKRLKIYLYKNIISNIRLQIQMYDKTFKWQNIFKSL